MNGGQDWDTIIAATPGGGSAMAATGLCGSGMNQSPINIAESLAVYDNTLLPLNVSYGLTTGWTMAVTGA